MSPKLVSDAQVLGTCTTGFLGFVERSWIENGASGTQISAETGFKHCMLR